MNNNMEKIDKAIEILQAFKEGKTIEYYVENTNQWLEMTIKKDGDIFYLLYNFEVRIKPEPKYRPYKDKYEFAKAMKEHGPMIELYGCDLLVVIKATVNGIYLQKLDYQEKLRIISVSYSELLDGKNKWQDGSPCGITE